jgi:hypothetical protein
MTKVETSRHAALASRSSGLRELSEVGELFKLANRGRLVWRGSWRQYQLSMLSFFSNPSMSRSITEASSA